MNQNQKRILAAFLASVGRINMIEETNKDTFHLRNSLTKEKLAVRRLEFEETYILEVVLRYLFSLLRGWLITKHRVRVQLQMDRMYRTLLT